MPLPGMDRPPLPSPDVQSQMGVPQPPPPGQGLSQLKPMSPEGSPAPGAPNPHGFLLAQVDAVKKVLDQIASAEPVFAPFAQKATQILDTGVSAVSTAPGGPGNPGPAGPGQEAQAQGAPSGSSQTPPLG
jgi:hypothetical protein